MPGVHAFDVLGDPVRRRLLELMAGGEQSAGEMTDVVRAEFGISQPAVSRHLRVLRENGFATARADGARRLYSVDAAGLREVASTRVLIAAGRLIAEGLSPRAAARAAIAGPLTDDPVVGAGLTEMIDAYLTEPDRPS